MYLHIFKFLHLDVSVKKQIVRVKVQSNQDVNDPVIKAAILEKVGHPPLPPILSQGRCVSLFQK